MQTQLADWIRDTPQGREADAILRKCVHCGFCLATCPTYNVLGDELDSPRGRIYLMKQALEGAPVTRHTQAHLDRCLTCRACETTCPSGVEYGKLVDIGRAVVAEKVARPPADRLMRAVLARVLPRPRLFGALLAMVRMVRPLLPRALARKIVPRTRPGAWPAPRHARRMLVLGGCVQRSMAPSINAAAARLLDRLGISLIDVPQAGCCGAVPFHLDYQHESLAYVRANVDAWWPHVEAGAEAILFTASGCGTTLEDYGRLLRDDPRYADRAARIAALAKDVSEVVAAERDTLRAMFEGAAPARLAFHSPCSLQHGLKLRGVVESILGDAGFTLTPVPDAHLCCGSAGTYSLLHPAIANRLRDDKVRALESGAPAAVATANVGCLAHIGAGTRLPIRHWVEVVESRAAGLR